MWDRIDTLIARAPDHRALKFHRVELLEARRRRAAGIEVGPELNRVEATAAVSELAVPSLLTRVRAVCDNPLVLIKGPDVALDYPGPRLRRFNDIDLLTDDAPAVQAAMLAAGFVEVGEAWVYENIHHLRPLWWPGLPLIVELHERVKWADGLAEPSTAELIASRVPSRLGIPGIDALPPAEHTLVVAAHAWSHGPIARLGQLLDVAVTLQRTTPEEVDALARRWECRALWKTTHSAIRSVTEGGPRVGHVAIWGRHLLSARERTVFETHLSEAVAPRAARAKTGAPRALRREPGDTWRAKLLRVARAARNAGTTKADHDLVS